MFNGISMRVSWNMTYEEQKLLFHYERVKVNNKWTMLLKGAMFIDFIKEYYGEITKDMNVNDMILMYECQYDVICEDTRKSFVNSFNKELFLKFNPMDK